MTVGDLHSDFDDSEFLWVRVPEDAGGFEIGVPFEWGSGESTALAMDYVVRWFTAPVRDQANAYVPVIAVTFNGDHTFVLDFEAVENLVGSMARQMQKFRAGAGRKAALQERRRSRQVAASVSSVEMCARCRKRRRHFDDLCKRCANEVGVRPTGKVQ